MPNEDGTYTKEEFESAVQDSNAKLAEANARANTLEDEQTERQEAEVKAKAQAEAAQRVAGQDRDFTETELQSAVESGSITEEVMQQQLQIQFRRGIKKETLEEFRMEDKQRREQEKIATGIQTMQETFPELKDRRSDTRKRMMQEFDRLREDLGLPDDQTTTLLAMERVCGNPKNASRDRTRENHQHEAGVGESATGANEAESAGGAPSGLSSDRVQYYEYLFQQGQYSGWDDPMVKEELKYIQGAA